MRYITIFFIVFSNFLFGATNYYVSNSGLNTNDGLSISTPFKTVTYASTIAKHGDTINVMAGTYTNETYGTLDIWKQEQAMKISNVNSTSGEYLVIRPYNNQKVIFKCDGDFIIQIRNSSYIKIEGFEIYGETENITLDFAIDNQFAYREGTNTTTINRVPPRSTPNEIEALSPLPDLSKLTITRPSYFNTHGIVLQSSNHIDITNNIVHHLPGEGIRFTSCDYINIKGNTVHNCARRSSTGVHGISCYKLASGSDLSDDVKITISGNLVYNNQCELFSWSELKTFITPEIDEGKGITVQRTYSGNGWEHGRIRIENNITYGNGFSGIHVNDGERIDIINNTVFNNTKSQRGSNTGISIQGGKDVKVINNIVVSNNSYNGYALSAGASSSLIIKNNLIQGTIDNDVDLIDSNTIFENPLFNDTIQFNLQNTSPAINNALSDIAPTIDFYTTNRDSLPDIGAVEYDNSFSTSITNLTNKDYILFPNPTNGIVFINNSKEDSIKTYSIDGKDITNQLQIKKCGSNTSIDLSNYNNGVYFIKINNQFLKLIKTN